MCQNMPIASRSQSWRALVASFALFGYGQVSAQYEVGVSGGVFISEMYTPTSANRPVTYAPGPSTPYAISAWYRERGEKRVGLGLGLQWTHRSFRADYFEGGLGGGTDYSATVNVNFIHLNIGPEVRLDRNGRLCFRTGPQFGFLVGGTSDGTKYSWSMGGPSSRSTFNDEEIRSTYRGDLRWLFGLGIWSALSQRFSLSLDPYASLGITSLHQDPTVMKSMDAGLKVSVGLRVQRRPFWESLRAGAPK